MATPCEPSVSVAAPAAGVVPGRGPMRMPRRQRWVPTGILAKKDEVIVPVAPPPQYQVSQSVASHQRHFIRSMAVALISGRCLDLN
jgi:hypothetical protein